MSISKREARRKAAKGRDLEQHGLWEVIAGGYPEGRRLVPKRIAVVRGTLGQALGWATGPECRYLFRGSGYAIGTVEPYKEPTVIDLMVRRTPGPHR